METKKKETKSLKVCFRTTPKQLKQIDIVAKDLKLDRSKALIKVLFNEV
jgi:hypothetical protein